MLKNMGSHYPVLQLHMIIMHVSERGQQSKKSTSGTKKSDRKVGGGLYRVNAVSGMLAQ